MLSQTTEYALRAVVHLAHRHPHPQTTAQIAAATKVPKPYLAKVLQALVRSGIVRSQRGIGGGVSLARATDQCTILDIVQAVDPIVRIETCPLGIASHGRQLCPLHARLDFALAGVEKAFANTTLQEVLTEPSASIPLCEFPVPTEERGSRPALQGSNRRKRSSIKKGANAG
jgi:Rrf2 family protein